MRLDEILIIVTEDLTKALTSLEQGLGLSHGESGLAVMQWTTKDQPQVDVEEKVQNEKTFADLLLPDKVIEVKALN